ncbi:DUF1236 domain-containing protein [Arsenicitalea aurantiaca]|uniref:DUF1236 domain-containing protein n=1 Tax=Arsenicitalea aurantiaca TaxID=1783274 RepID=A0A433X8J7_9HYPH|nr:DUF1236 domain-containing protein [Arsenicitalea aurantiaca]RUT30370.1 DUF1236 domain-containing protein [Arsenicitalea aurantiaca]
MRKFLLAGVAIAALGLSTPVLAQNTDGAALAGGTAGGAAGGTIGFLVGGPLGAIVGGFAGAVLGAEATVSAASVEYAARNPVDPIYLETAIEPGFVVDASVTVYPIEGDDQFGYFYANNRVYIVDLASREVVQSPGYAIPEASVAYIQANPRDAVIIEGDIAPGFVIDPAVELVPIPDDPAYAYVYINDRPALVDTWTRTVVWIG